MPLKMGVTSKLITIIGVLMALGFAFIVIEQWASHSDDLHAIADKNRQAMTRLLAQGVSEAVRQNEAELIEQAYDKFVWDRDAGVGNVIIADVDGNTISTFKHSSLAVADLGKISAQWIKGVASEGSTTVQMGSHTVVVAKIPGDTARTPAGYVAVAYSNAEVIGVATSSGAQAMILSLLAMAVLLGMLFPILRVLLTRPMASLNDIAQQLTQGDGDLTRRMKQESNDELGQFAGAINAYFENLQSSMTRVVSCAGTVHGSVASVSESVAKNRQLLDRHSSEMKQTNGAVKTLSSKLEGMATTAQGLAKTTADASGIAQSANKLVDEAVVAVQGLTAKVHETESVIRDLDERSQNIGSVLDVIKSIAEQTNLLALNAAIEAARAGEQGRGFAVVADEVRTLASRTQQSTEEIQKIIESLQTGAQKAVTTMEQGQKDVSVSSDQIGKVKELLVEIVGHMNGISTTNTEVANDVNEQSGVAKNISDSIAKITGLSDSINENVKFNASECDKMSSVSDDLNRQIAFFKV